MGIGGAPEGVHHRRRHALPQRRDLARLVIDKPEQEERCARWASRTRTGSTRPKISRRASNIIFAATGVTDGALLKGVRFFGDGIAHQSLGHS